VAVRRFVVLAATTLFAGAAALACSSGGEGGTTPGPETKPVGARCEDTPGPGGSQIAVGARLPALRFEGAREDGAPGTVAVADYFEPCAPASRVLVVRVHGGAWCGTCAWHADHTSELASLDISPRLRFLDLVVGDRDNAPAGAADAVAFRAAMLGVAGNGTVKIAVGADPTFAFRAVADSPGVPLPLYVLVDTRTLTVRDFVSNPDPAELRHRLRSVVAALDGAPKPARTDEPLVDGIFHRNEWDLVRAMTLPGAPPADPTNAVADAPDAAALGKVLFADTSLSPSGTVSCATCHDPQKQMSDGLPRGKGVAEGDRKTPDIVFAAFSRAQFWDGRAETLWAQALGPFENPKEFDASRVFVVRRVAARYADAYAKAFPGTPLPDPTTLPAAGKPGDAAYDALAPQVKTDVTRAFVNVGKAIAAYERTFRAKPNALDRYIGGDPSALSVLEMQGLSIFAQAGCMQCHWGPRLTDDAFHNTRMPTGRADGAADPGRSEGIAALLRSEFRASGRWSDAPSAGSVEPVATKNMLGAFKTPALRGTAGLSFYGHGGTAKTLVDVTELYGQGGLAGDDRRAVGDNEPWLMPFSVAAQWSIPPFLGTLTAEPIVP
jgi:cytochrome c peroxidase